MRFDSNDLCSVVLYIYIYKNVSAHLIAQGTTKFRNDWNIREREENILKSYTLASSERVCSSNARHQNDDARLKMNDAKKRSVSVCIKRALPLECSRLNCDCIISLFLTVLLLSASFQR